MLGYRETGPRTPRWTSQGEVRKRSLTWETARAPDYDANSRKFSADQLSSVIEMPSGPVPMDSGVVMPSRFSRLPTTPPAF